jgi:hypothetical protein
VDRWCAGSLDSISVFNDDLIDGENHKFSPINFVPMHFSLQAVYIYQSSGSLEHGRRQITPDSATNYYNYYNQNPTSTQK